MKLFCLVQREVNLVTIANSHPFPEENLRRELASNVKKAFPKLVSMFEPRVRVVAWKLTLDHKHEDVEKSVQEIFKQMLEYLEGHEASHIETLPLWETLYGFILKHCFAHLYEQLEHTFLEEALVKTQHLYQDAEDIVQDVFYRAQRHLAKHGLDDTRAMNPEAWLHVILGNAIRAYWNKRNKFTSRTALAVSVENEPEGVLKEQCDTLIDAEQQMALKDGISKLSPTYREVMYLRYIEGYQYHEIAERLGKNLNTIKIRIKRGREKLGMNLQMCIGEIEGR